MANSKGVDAIAKFVQYLSLFTGVIVFVTGLVHILTISAKIHWPEGDFTDDLNKDSWRMTLFSFTPTVFVDSWTPIVFGVGSVLIQFEPFACKILHENWHAIFLLQFVTAMFATMGYAGGLGIIFSVFPLLVSLFALILGFVHSGPTTLDLPIKRR